MLLKKFLKLFLLPVFLMGSDYMNITSEEYIKRQEQAWNSMSNGWKKWWSLFDSELKVVSNDMINFANIEENSRVLDLATGIGEPAITVSQILNSTGFVLGTDISQQMIDIAQERKKDLGLTNIEFEKIDISKFQLNNREPFDAVLCRLGIMLVPDLDQATNIVRKSLKKGGYFVSSVFSKPSKSQNLQNHLTCKPVWS